MQDCIFCRIVSGEVPTEIEKATDRVIVIKEARPLAATHLLIIPKDHLKDIREVENYLWDDVRKMITEIAVEKKVEDFRIVTYAGGTELVPHVSFHFLSSEGVKLK